VKKCHSPDDALPAVRHDGVHGADGSTPAQATKSLPTEQRKRGRKTRAQQGLNKPAPPVGPVPLHFTAMSDRTSNILCSLIAAAAFAMIGIAFGTTPHDGERLTHHGAIHQEAAE